MTEAAEQDGEVALEPADVEIGRRRLAGEQHDDLRQETCVLAPEREQQEEDELAHVRVDIADHAEVEEVDPVLPPEQVAGVRVRVEEAVLQYLAVVGIQELARRLL